MGCNLHLSLRCLNQAVPALMLLPLYQIKELRAHLHNPTSSPHKNISIVNKCHLQAFSSQLGLLWTTALSRSFTSHGCKFYRIFLTLFDKWMSLMFPHWMPKIYPCNYCVYYSFIFALVLSKENPKWPSLLCKQSWSPLIY